MLASTSCAGALPSIVIEQSLDPLVRQDVLQPSPPAPGSCKHLSLTCPSLHSADGGNLNAVPRRWRETTCCSPDGEKLNTIPADGGKIHTVPADGEKKNAVSDDGEKLNAVPLMKGRLNAGPIDGGKLNAVPADGGKLSAIPDNVEKVNAVPADGGKINAASVAEGKLNAVPADGGKINTVLSDEGKLNAVPGDGEKLDAIPADEGKLKCYWGRNSRQKQTRQQAESNEVPCDRMTRRAAGMWRTQHGCWVLSARRRRAEGGAPTFSP